MPPLPRPREVTRRSIRALRDEAAEAGDLAQVALCETALHSEDDTEARAAWERCSAVIQEGWRNADESEYL